MHLILTVRGTARFIPDRVRLSFETGPLIVLFHPSGLYDGLGRVAADRLNATLG